MSTQPSDLEGLTLLGREAKPSKKLEAFPNRSPERYYLVKLETDEFTCLCPMTGQPDFAHIRVLYVPDQKVVESKSFKLYLWSYRNEGAFHEHVVNKILADLVNILDPHWIKVTGIFNVRGGIGITIEAEHTKTPEARGSSGTARMDRKGYRWFNFITALFVTTLIVSNIIAVKIINIAGLYLPAAVILFPIAYIFGDVLTEVYGYARARQVIWTGFFCNLLAVIAIWIGGQLPAAPFWSAGAFSSPGAAQQAYQAILGFAPRLLAASFIAYLIGEFLNSFVLAKLKLRTAGRFLWLRTITSTLVGEGANSAVFISIAFWGIFPGFALVQAILSQWLFKVTYEVLATPLTYWVVNALKKSEHEDYYDRETDFNPVTF